jgi:hypothetical protein
MDWLNRIGGRSIPAILGDQIDKEPASLCQEGGQNGCVVIAHT